MSESKKQWTMPQLIVLGRGTPEENVLQACKTAMSLTGPKSNREGCRENLATSCTNCNEITLT